jgi:hypothetical protein
MTTIPDDGLEWRGDIEIANIEYVAVGTGSGESNTASDLQNRVFKAQVSDSIVDINETGSTGEYEIVIRLKGGTEVSGGTEISEMAVFGGDPDAGGLITVIDEFPGKTIEAGHQEEFTLPIDPSRP